MIIARDLSAAYDEKRALNHASFTIDDTASVFIIGPNGSGKSTLLKCIAGLLDYTGSLTIDGFEVKDMKKTTLAKKLAYLPQVQAVPPGMKVYDFVSFGRYPYLGRFEPLTSKDHQIIMEKLEECGVVEFKDREVDSLSGGERQRVFLAKALAQEPKILLLDEALTYLDYFQQLTMMKNIQEIVTKNNILMINVIHDLNLTFQYSEKVLILQASKLVSFGRTETELNPEIIKKVFGLESRFVEISEKSPSYLITDLTI